MERHDGSDGKAEDSGLKGPGFNTQPRQEKQNKTRKAFIDISPSLFFIVTDALKMHHHNFFLYFHESIYNMCP